MAPYCQHFRFNDWHLLKTLRDKNSFLQEAAQTSPPSPVDVAPQAEPRQRKGIRLQAQPSDLATHAAGLPWPWVHAKRDQGNGKLQNIDSLWRAEIHRDQAIVESFNRTLAECLFRHRSAVEMLLPTDQRSTALVKRLPDVVSALNNEVINNYYFKSRWIVTEYLPSHEAAR